jgi:hypothetical protein
VIGNFGPNRPSAQSSLNGNLWSSAAGRSWDDTVVLEEEREGRIWEGVAVRAMAKRLREIGNLGAARIGSFLHKPRSTTV